LAVQRVVSNSSAHRAIKILKLNPNKTNVTQKLFPQCGEEAGIAGGFMNQQQMDFT